MALSQEKFQQGMTTQEYIEYIKVNKQPFIDIYNGVQVPDDTKAYFDGLEEPLNLAVFTSDWCGDAMSTTPAILKLADATDKLNLQVSAVMTNWKSPIVSCPRTGPAPCPYSSPSTPKWVRFLASSKPLVLWCRRLTLWTTP